ncbi:MAG: response regulator [Magnetovibrio sp.]|nr:response regulator [Magnetovibrio sp.]
MAGITLSLALLWYGTSAVKLVLETERVWSDYNRTSTATSQLMNRINKHLGYGGFIHNFKNYILRADDQYLLRLNDDQQAVSSAISEYRTLNISDAEYLALARLSAVLDQYMQNIQAAKIGFAHGQESAEIDQTVKINDEPALKALAALSKAALERSLRNEMQTQDWLDRTIAYLSWGLVIIPLVLFSTVVMVHFMRQTLKANEVAQAAQKETEELLQSAPDAMLTVNSSGDIVRANRQAEVVFGYTRDELSAMHIEDLIPLHYRAMHKVERDGYFDHPHPRPMGRELDLKGVTREGLEIPLEISLSTLEQDGEMYATATVRDISERLKAEQRVRENEERLSLSEGIANVGTWDWNVPTEDMFWSSELYSIFGVNSDSITPSCDAFYEFIHPDDLERVKTAMQAALDSDVLFDTEHRIILKNGHEKYVHERGQVFRDSNGKPERMLGVVLDITERKAIMDALESAKSAADHASNAKSEFLANMSHEIRTPMNAILGMGYLALKTNLNRQQSDYLNKMLGSARSLLRIINDILDFSKIEAGKLDLEQTPFSLAQVMEDVSNVVGASLDDKRLEVLFYTEPDVPGWLVGDPLRLEQILINLLGNSVKFTEQGEVVLRVNLEDAAEDGTVTLKFTVRDTGIGMGKPQVDNLFEAFRQADTSTTRKFGGTGLGLSITQRLVSMMGGEITVESKAGMGATFAFTVQVKAQGKRMPPLEVPDELKGAPALIVDDNETSREILSDILTLFGFKAVAVHSGEAAVAEILRVSQADEPPYEVVLMDWVMGGIDGLETTERIRGNTKLKKAPMVIMVTAYGRDLVVGRAQQVGLDGYLLKPITSSVLFETLMDVLGYSDHISGHNLLDQAPQSKGKVLNGTEILVVEDNAINQQVAQEILEEAGARVEIAEDGDKAYRRLCVDKKQYDAVLMDLHMPIMDGYVATELIRETFVKDDLAIIAMTANAMRGEREKCLDVGMNDFVTKPIDVDALYETLLRWIPNARLREAQQQSQDMEPQYKMDSPSSDEQITLPMTLDGFDMEDGLERMLGRPKLYLKFLRKLPEGHANDAIAVREALNQGDMDEAHRLAHTIKGVAGNLSALDLYMSATQLSNAIREGSGDLSELVDSFEKELERAVQSVNTL